MTLRARFTVRARVRARGRGRVRVRTTVRVRVRGRVSVRVGSFWAVPSASPASLDASARLSTRSAPASTEARLSCSCGHC